MFPVLLVLSLGCGAPPVQAPPERRVAAVELSPADLEVDTRSSGGDGVQLQATVTYDDGVVEDGTTQVEWGSSNETAGLVDATGWFQPATDNGGVTWITGRLAGVEGRSTVTVVWQDDRVEEGADPSLFEGTGAATPASLWLYPEDGVSLPRNTPGVNFQWAAPEGVVPDAWQVRFRSALTDITVTTTASSWTADEATWQAIASTNAGGTVEVSLAMVSGGQRYEDAPIRVTVDRFDADGAIVYWSSSASGFLRIPYGQVAEPFLTSDQTGSCMGCHAISRDGDIAFTYDGGNGPMGIKDPDGVDIVGHDGGLTGNFKAWSPDGSRLVSSSDGVLSLWDTATWTSLGTVPVSGMATQVDWSPDGTLLAMVLPQEESLDWIFSGGAVAVMEVLDGDRFGAVTVLYTPPAGQNAYYPAFSPDGDWLAFNVSTGDSYDDPDAELWVIPTRGGTALPLDRANGDGQRTNSWPRWGPLPDDEILWLAFSSKRPYGAITAGNPQIWVAAFDPAVADLGLDPSYPAFWLPNQDTAQSNHIPVWTR